MNKSFATVTLGFCIRRISSSKVKTQSYRNIASKKRYYFKNSSQWQMVTYWKPPFRYNSVLYYTSFVGSCYLVQETKGRTRFVHLEWGQWSFHRRKTLKSFCRIKLLAINLVGIVIRRMIWQANGYDAGCCKGAKKTEGCIYWIAWHLESRLSVML